MKAVHADRVRVAGASAAEDAQDRLVDLIPAGRPVTRLAVSSAAWGCAR